MKMSLKRFLVAATVLCVAVLSLTVGEQQNVLNAIAAQIRQDNSGSNCTAPVVEANCDHCSGEDCPGHFGIWTDSASQITSLFPILPLPLLSFVRCLSLFTFLRFSDIGGNWLTLLPTHIGQLTSLRYLFPIRSVSPASFLVIALSKTTQGNSQQPPD